RHPEFAALNRADRETVCKLAAILRVADALDISHDARVEDVRCAREGDSVRVELSGVADCEKEVWAAERKSDLFEQTFGWTLTFVSCAEAEG
ncbi:MAG TPA: hypothetical protein VEQ42_11885, partial [Pyrinomonadaceae bacterium]|nr:hypothetical protein [Pyrinomonadaceae bacterium]